MVKLLLMHGADPAVGKGAQEVVDMLEARPGIS